jgi:hypothetical protein
MNNFAPDLFIHYDHPHDQNRDAGLTRRHPPPRRERCGTGDGRLREPARRLQEPGMTPRRLN